MKIRHIDISNGHSLGKLFQTPYNPTNRDGSKFKTQPPNVSSIFSINHQCLGPVLTHTLARTPIQNRASQSRSLFWHFTFYQYWAPLIMHFSRIVPYKPSSYWVPHLWKAPFIPLLSMFNSVPPRFFARFIELSAALFQCGVQIQKVKQ